MGNKRIQNLLDKDAKKSSEKDKRVKTVNIVLAIVLAVFLWAYVIGEVNPEAEKTLVGVPLNVVGKNALTAQHLVVLTEFEDTITAVIAGRRSEIYGMTASRLSARIDVSDCVEGENQVAIRVTAPSNVADAVAKDGNLVVVVDKLISAEKPVDITMSGEQSSGTTIEIKQKEFESIKVSGPSTYVDKVDSVMGVLKVKSGPDEYSQAIALIPVDEDGNLVEGVELEKDVVNVEAVKSLKKTVPVTVELVGNPADGLHVKLVQDTNIKIQGSYSVVNDINSLEAAAVDISNITQNTTVDMLVRLPDGVTAVDSFGEPLVGQEAGTVTIKLSLEVTGSADTETEE